ncbi:hypothetical protein [Actinomadura rupiterrae]|uniref:hypothetical protein n=1 Tax=Actinomadura rupiterrae TaxID=559627 RepID=UPI0020A41EF0|nr:hypothetical protein [Actinomadura rupiterrae]MCP2339228.1 hypothetical protein [Actinomadura rupiterrae]
MTVRIEEAWLSSDTSRHMARRYRGRWIVSWLPRGPMEHRRAVTAMVLADRVAAGQLRDSADRMLATQQAGELGLTLDQALGMISAEPLPRDGAS